MAVSTEHLRQFRIDLALGDTAESADELLSRFALVGGSNIVEPNDFGIFNGMATIGVDYADAVGLSGIWAPPYANGSFSLSVSFNGNRAATSQYTWYPYKVERQAILPGVSLATSTILVAGRRAGLVTLTFTNIGDVPTSVATKLSFTAGTRFCADDWGFAQPADSATPSAGVTTLSNSAATSDLPDGGHVELAVGERKTYCVAFAIGGAHDAELLCEEMIADPSTFIRYAYDEFVRKARELFRRVPRLSSDNTALEAMYARSVLHLLLHRWEVPKHFRLYPYYSTGSIRGGCVCDYLWNFGEGWEMISLYDPDAAREHILQFLSIDLESHFAFTPRQGTGIGPWYPVNQEKIIGLVYYYVSLTGDASLLSTPLTQQSSGVTKTVLEWIRYQAVVKDDVTLPVALIDYGIGPGSGGWQHLELPSLPPHYEPIYEGILPDLNGRRYLNYVRAHELLQIGGNSTGDLLARADSLKTLLRYALWDEQAQWFRFRVPAQAAYPQGYVGTRWTVQMYYLIGSPVLDDDQRSGLLQHLNTNEFLSEDGLHSLSKADPLYGEFPGRPDNGGAGCCTSFPPQIIERLYLDGHVQQADEILGSILWWGTVMPYWGDSIYATERTYRKNTPLQCTIDGIAVAQMMIFGLMGIALKPQGNVAITPRPTSLAAYVGLTGLRIRGAVLDISLRADSFTVAVSSSGRALSVPIGRTVLLDPTTVGLLTIDLRFDGFDAQVDRLFAASGDTVYWQAGIQLRRGTVTNGALQIDLRFDGFDAQVDRLFAASGDIVYWQAGNQLRRGTVTNGALNIDLRFDGFDAQVDRLFTASDDTLYWQAGKQLRRGIVV